MKDNFPTFRPLIIKTGQAANRYNLWISFLVCSGITIFFYYLFSKYFIAPYIIILFLFVIYVGYNFFVKANSSIKVFLIFLLGLVYIIFLVSGTKYLISSHGIFDYYQQQNAEAISILLNFLLAVLNTFIPLFIIQYFIDKSKKISIHFVGFISLGAVATVVTFMISLFWERLDSSCIHSGWCGLGSFYYAILFFVFFIIINILHTFIMVISSLPYSKKINTAINHGYEKSLKFYPIQKQPFTTTNKDIIKIAEQVQEKFGKTNFQPNELQEFYNEFIKSYQPKLQGEQLVMVVKKLKEFVEAGGRFEIS